jgi:hypothetical protein
MLTGLKIDSCFVSLSRGLIFNLQRRKIYTVLYNIIQCIEMCGLSWWWPLVQGCKFLSISVPCVSHKPLAPLIPPLSLHTPTHVIPTISNLQKKTLAHWKSSWSDTVTLVEFISDGPSVVAVSGVDPDHFDTNLDPTFY